jgi:hypothetical protein
MKFNESRKIAEAIREFDYSISLMVNDMGQIALNHFTKGFRDGGFTDVKLEPWKPRKRTRGNDGRAILVKTGALRKLRKQKLLRKQNERKKQREVREIINQKKVENNLYIKYTNILTIITIITILQYCSLYSKVPLKQLFSSF